MSQNVTWALLTSGILLLAIWFVVGMLAGGWNILDWAKGVDGRISTSRFQLLLWMIVIVYAFLAVFMLGRFNRSSDLIPNIPGNVLIALGFTGTTAITAMGITGNKVQSGAVDKIPPSVETAQGGNPRATGLYGAFQADDGTADLGKIQMLTWTLVALGVYIYRLIVTLQDSSSGQPPLPDIDPALLVLTGLAQGTYIGHKLVTTSTPRLFALVPNRAPFNTVVTIKGASFGDAQNGSLLLVGGTPLLPNSWSDTSIPFTVPARDPRTGVAWVTPSQCPVDVVVDGKSSSGALILTVTSI